MATSPSRRASRTQVDEQRRSVPCVVVDGEAFGAELADDQHLEAELLAQFLHGGQVAGVAAAEPGVVADHHVAGLEAVHQDRGDEFFGGQAGEFERVLHHQHGVEAELAEGHELVLQPHDQLGGRLGTVHLRGVRIEGDGDGAGVVQPGGADELREHLLVAAVHAVEIAERDNGRTKVRRDFGRIVPDVDHQPRLLLPAMNSSGATVPAPELS